MKEKLGWQSNSKEATEASGINLKPKLAKTLGIIAGISLLFPVYATAKQVSRDSGAKYEKLPDDTGFKSVPRYKKYKNASEAEKAINDEFEANEPTLPPEPQFDKQSKSLFKACVDGVYLYPVSRGNGAFLSARIDDDEVGMQIFSNDDCGYTQSRIVIGLEERKNKKDLFEEVNTPPGIIKYFASMPEYGTAYSETFKMDDSCKTNPELEVRFTLTNVTTSIYQPAHLKSKPLPFYTGKVGMQYGTPEKTQQTITC